MALYSLLNQEVPLDEHINPANDSSSSCVLVMVQCGTSLYGFAATK